MKIGKQLKVYVKVFLILNIIFVGALSIVYCIPNSWIEKNANEGITYLEDNEGLHANHYYQSDASIIDGFTDRGDLSCAIVSEDVSNPIYAAMSVNNYARYWHGYQVVLRPALVLFSYFDIRYLNQFILLIMLAICFALLSKKTDMGIAVIFMISIIMTYPFVVSVNIQYMIANMVMLFSVLYLLRKYEPGKDWGLFFFAVGCIINFFDLLTFPLITLGMPLIILLVLRIRNENNCWVKNFCFAVKNSLIWVVGYAATWFAKWVIGSIVLRKNVFADALEVIGFRTMGNEEYEINRIDTLIKNIKAIFPPAKMTAIALIALAAAVMLILLLKKREQGKYAVCRTSVLLAPAMIPVIWVVVLSNHSQIHWWFTYRMFMISVFSCGCFWYECVYALYKKCQ